jgi:hypothetical protein
MLCSGREHDEIMSIADNSNSATFLQALALVEQGIPCFPCRGDKRPATPRGFKDATRDHDALRELWGRQPAPLIGVPTGGVSGFDVLDIDRRHGGQIWFLEHADRLLPTRWHGTRGGGLHLLFQHAAGLRCSGGKIAAGVDVRATGGYIIWWPAAGLPSSSEMTVSPWPEWLRVQLSSPVNPRIRVPDDHALMRLVRLVAGASAGERNKLTFWAACRAGEMVASGLLKADRAVAIIAEAATRAGLPRAEAERTAWSGIRSTGGLDRV